jgi:hypothetical protein
MRAILLRGLKNQKRHSKEKGKRYFCMWVVGGCSNSKKKKSESGFDSPFVDMRNLYQMLQ